MSRSKWEKVGVVQVEAGVLMLLDPCNLRDVLFPGNAQVERWYDQVVVAEDADEFPVRSKAGRTGLPIGHVVSTGDGDGTYAVEVLWNDEGRVAELRVRFY